MDIVGSELVVERDAGGLYMDAEAAGDGGVDVGVE